MLEVVLQNLRGQGRGHTLTFSLTLTLPSSLSLSLSLRFDGADHFSAADDFGGGEPGNFCRQHQANLHLYVRKEPFLGLEQQSGTADVLGGARAPALFSERTIAQRQVEIETASSEGWNLLFGESVSAG